MALNINGTTGISGVDGSVSAPALTGTDSNTGITFPSADTIKFATGGVERMAITNSGITGIPSGILMADQWRRTAGVSTNGSENFLTTDWSRVGTPMGTILSGAASSGMTQNSGVFTFPTTGIYFVTWQAYAEVSSTSRMTAVNIYISATDGTDFGNLASSISGVNNDISGYSYSNGHCSALVDVTNVNNVKVKFRVYSSGNVTWDATSAENRNCATFIRLGDT